MMRWRPRSVGPPIIPPGDNPWRNRTPSPDPAMRSTARSSSSADMVPATPKKQRTLREQVSSPGNPPCSRSLRSQVSSPEPRVSRTTHLPATCWHGISLDAHTHVSPVRQPRRDTVIAPARVPSPPRPLSLTHCPQPTAVTVLSIDELETVGTLPDIHAGLASVLAATATDELQPPIGCTEHRTEYALGVRSHGGTFPAAGTSSYPLA